MPHHHVVAGDCLTSIAEQYGFFWQTLWNHPENAPLQEMGRHPNTLQPGDRVFIPEKAMKSFFRPTGARHIWRMRGIPAKLRVQIKRDGVAIANKPYALTIDGAPPVNGSTDGDGWVDSIIPPKATRGTLTVGEGDEAMHFDLHLGHLAPVESFDGVTSRLRNLGYHCPEELTEGSPAMRAVLEAFQSREGLAVTGELDEATRTTLRERHDGQ